MANTKFFGGNRENMDLAFFGFWKFTVTFPKLCEVQFKCQLKFEDEALGIPRKNFKSQKKYLKLFQIAKQGFEPSPVYVLQISPAQFSVAKLNPKSLIQN